MSVAIDTVLSTVVWDKRDVEIKNSSGDVIFSAKDLEFPVDWSQNCACLVAEKYFRKVLQADGSLQKETSVKQMISRVVETISKWGKYQGYFIDGDLDAFEEDLTELLVHQKAAFNSPVWFNVGTTGGKMRTEQASACFILGVEDNMESILDLSKKEGFIYKGGSGSGVNYSSLRSSREKLSRGGYASGPVSFLVKDDANAGAVKSGGITRRAARISILDIDHGDILDFIKCKATAERAAHALIDAGFDGDFRSRFGAYQLVPFQNVNNTVRVSNAFMCAVELDNTWDLLDRKGGVLETVKAKDLWNEICKAAHFCGDPGIQFDDTINLWNPVKESGKIVASNPCSEFMHLNNTACNLASINLIKFLNEKNEFDIKGYKDAIEVLVTAMDILVDGASYPTKELEENSHKFRPLGLGVSNLGAFLMAQGIPYDSDEGRSQASSLMAILTGSGYIASSELSKRLGSFEEFEKNKDSMNGVIQHHDARVVSDTKWLGCDFGSTAYQLRNAALNTWGITRDCCGFRNSQISVCAPTGTIAFLMDCDTTGIEPELSLVKTKKLVGGGAMKIVNQQVERSVRSLLPGADEKTVAEILDYIKQTGSVRGFWHPKARLYMNVFDTAFPDPVKGECLSIDAHIKMMAAIQPFISGAISKTVNLPSTATEKDVSEVYTEAWKHGLKSVALYRDGSKRTQPLQTAQKKEVVEVVKVVPAEVAKVATSPRRKLPKDVESTRHKFKIGQHSGYFHVGRYQNGDPGEIFIKMNKQGSTIAGLMDAIGILTSVSLQYGVPLEVLVDRFSFTSFEPAGITDNPDLRFVKSPLDYLFRWLGKKFLKVDVVPESCGLEATEVMEKAVVKKSSGHTCGNCGNPAQRAGVCLTCPTCGWSEGCG